MNFEAIPRAVLSHGCTLICGIIVGAWCASSTETTKRHHTVKSGFILNIPLSSEADILAPTVDKSPALKILLRQSNGLSDDCELNLESANVIERSRMFLIRGNLRDIEKITKLIPLLQSSKIKVRASKDGSPVRPCLLKPKISYGNAP